MEAAEQVRVTKMFHLMFSVRPKRFDFGSSRLCYEFSEIETLRDRWGLMKRDSITSVLRVNLAVPGSKLNFGIGYIFILIILNFCYDCYLFDS